tara:strand:- start:706 stop:2784 length:2079 start_codon:yes stop_codon:yes gene_type:complete
VNNIIFILIFLPAVVFSQNEANIWYFGENAGIDFNSGSPVALTDGQLYTDEGCATISDTSGNLLFYTDGSTVYDKNHAIMPNGTGLLGNNSSTQSAIIVKKPGSNTIYYIFTVGAVQLGGGLYYSQVDMSLNGGLGNINGTKNIPLIQLTCEKVTAVIHQNSYDFWIVSRADNSNSYHAYLLTSTGLDNNPVTTNIGDIYNGTGGYMKGTSDGKRIAVANYFTSNNVDLYDFDNSTGILSNLITLTMPDMPYGIEFSPNNNILYVSCLGNIYQFDLLLGSAADIFNSMVHLNPNTSGSGQDFPWALQLASNNKIYTAAYELTSLGVINNPNVLGLGSDYVPGAVSLLNRRCRLGLPTFFSSIFNPPKTHINDFTFTNVCIGDTAYFVINDNSVDSVLWDFGDAIRSTHFNPSHLFSDTGVFNVHLYSFLDEHVDTISYEIIVHAVPEIDLGSDTVICYNSVLNIDVTTDLATYLWQDSTTNSTFQVTSQGEYFVHVNVNGCLSSDTINVTYNTVPSAHISGNYEVCYGENISIEILPIGSAPFEITYSNGITSNTVVENSLFNVAVDESGIYEVTSILDKHGCVGTFSGFAEVIIDPCSLTIYIPNTFTPNTDLHNNQFIPSIYDIDELVSYTIKIFNRWGDPVFLSNNKDYHWDGKYNGIDVQDGLYSYLIFIKDVYENVYQIKGNIMLIK